MGQDLRPCQRIRAAPYEQATDALAPKGHAIVSVQADRAQKNPAGCPAG